MDVVREIERIWAREVEQARVMKSGETRWFRFPPGGDDPSPSLSCGILPRRIFRHQRSTTDTLCSPVPPLLEHLFSRYTPSPNSHRGYPLARAVLHGDTPLTAFLLTHGADPAEKDFLAVEIALTRRDIRVLRLLIDGPGDPVPLPPINQSPTDTCVNGKRKRTSSAFEEGDSHTARKRARTSSRTTAGSSRRSKVVPVRLTQPLVDKALVKGTPEIIRYIVDEKGKYSPFFFVGGMCADDV